MDNQISLRKRHARKSADHCYHGMEYFDEHGKIVVWAPLITEGRDSTQPVAATHKINGVDVIDGALTKSLAYGGAGPAAAPHAGDRRSVAAHVAGGNAGPGRRRRSGSASARAPGSPSSGEDWRGRWAEAS